MPQFGIYSALAFKFPSIESRRAFLCFFFLCAIFLSCSACTPRSRIAPGVVPVAKSVPQQDEQYGLAVLGGLTSQYPLSRDDQAIDEVKEIVAKLSAAVPGTDPLYPWHAYLLEGPEVKNAAATRGNFIFAWTGILNTVDNDDQLAAVLAHEMGHVLAGHTAANPQLETARILGAALGQATEAVMAHRAGNLVAGLAGKLMQSGLQALVVNPELQSKELEADQIGLFLMADAGFNPEEAIFLWQRVKDQPEFRVNGGMFSTHPSTEERLKELSELLPAAVGRYRLRQDPQINRRYARPVERPRSREIPRNNEVGDSFSFGKRDYAN